MAMLKRILYFIVFFCGMICGSVALGEGGSSAIAFQDLTAQAHLSARLHDEEQAYHLTQQGLGLLASVLVDYQQVKMPLNHALQTAMLTDLSQKTAQLQREVASLAIQKETVAQDLIAQENIIYELESKLQEDLQSDDQYNEKIRALQLKIQTQRNLLDTNRLRLKILEKHTALLRNALDAHREFLNQITTEIELKKKELQDEQRKMKAAHIEQDIQQWTQKILAYQKHQYNPKLYEKIYPKIVEAEQERTVLELERSKVSLQGRVAEIAFLFSGERTQPIKNQRNLREHILRLQKEVEVLKAVVEDKIKFLAVYLKEQKQDNLAIYGKKYTVELENLIEIASQLQSYSAILDDIYLKDISVRQKLPSKWVEWRLFFSDLTLIPVLLGRQCIAAQIQIDHYYTTTSFLNRVLFVCMECIWIFLTIFLFRLNSKFLSQEHFETRNRFLPAAAWVLSRILYGLLIELSICLNVLYFLNIANVSQASVDIVRFLVFIYLGTRLSIKLCRIILLENVFETGYGDLKLYNGLKRSFILGCFFGALSFLAQALNVNFLTQALVDRFFMLFLLSVSYPLIVNWRVLPTLVESHLKPKPYIRRVLQLIALLIPLTILSNAALGLIGYINLAWKIAKAEVQLLLVVVGWLIIVGLFSDLMNSLYGFFIRKVTNGWLWTESVLKPLHKIFNVISLIMTFSFLFFMYGWYQSAEFYQTINMVLNYYWMTISGVEIHTDSVIKLLIILMCVFWAAKWSQEFSYRWLYSGIKDLGVRNSLSVFTQYSTVVVGGVVILLTLGFSLGTLTVALGGVFVFLSFALKEIISNFVSGLILLIERPIRTGDLITIGAHEGKVTKMGIRALTIKTPNNMEVIVPNTETVTQSLTNWTFKDTVVRDELILRISYTENLPRIQHLVSDMIQANPDVLEQPPQSVYFHEFTDTAVLIRCFYFVDLSKTPNRPAIKSAILCALWNALNEAGISVAYPRQTVEFIVHDPEKIA
jgi:potassium efflux system protein